MSVVPVRLFGDPANRKAAMRAIREADWGGQPPVVKTSPHPLTGRLA